MHIFWLEMDVFEALLAVGDGAVPGGTDTSKLFQWEVVVRLLVKIQLTSRKEHCMECDDNGMQHISRSSPQVRIHPIVSNLCMAACVSRTMYVYIVCPYINILVPKIHLYFCYWPCHLDCCDPPFTKSIKIIPVCPINVHVLVMNS